MKCSGSIGNIVAAIAILILPFTEMNLLLLIVQTDYKYPGAPSTIEWSKIIGSICTIPFFLIQLAATFAVFYAIFHIFGSRLRRPNNMQVFDLASFKKRYWDDTVMRIDKSESNLQSFIKRYWVERDEILIIRQIPAEILIYFPNMLMSGWICADERLLAIMLAFILAKIVIDAISYFISCWLDWINYLWLRKICMDAAASAGVSYKPNALQLLEGLFKTDAYLFECFMIEFMPRLLQQTIQGFAK
jgi:hypothetical protein